MADNSIGKVFNADKEKMVVYTAITGNYDHLMDPLYVNENFDYICFTDDQSLKSDFWEIRLMEDLNLDNIKKARRYKVLPHVYLKEYNCSLWVDANFQIRDNLEDYINEYIGNSSMICFDHPYRNCIYQEAEICIAIKKDSASAINPQINKYKNENYPKEQGLISSGLLFRRHNDPDVIKLMNDWWNEIRMYSRRDQLSFNYVCWKNKFQYEMCDLFYFGNKYFIYKMHGDTPDNLFREEPRKDENVLSSLMVKEEIDKYSQCR